MAYTVRDEPDFEPLYDEDEAVTIRKGDLRALLDIASNSLDFGSGFLDNEQVEAMRATASLLGVSLTDVTPPEFRCQYAGGHDWGPWQDPKQRIHFMDGSDLVATRQCARCGGSEDRRRPADA